jgi:transcription antitermination factor NusG
MLRDILKGRTPQKPPTKAELERERRLWERAERERRRRDARIAARGRESEGMPWFAVFTQPQCEQKVEMQLIQRGLCAYLPEGRHWTKPRRSHVKQSVARPAFTRYVMVGFPSGSTSWHLVHAIPEVHSIVGQRLSGPKRLPALLIEKMRAAQDLGLFDAKVDARMVLELDEEVEITAGLMEGMTGHVRRIGSKTVEIDLGTFFAKAHVTLEHLKRVA